MKPNTGVESPSDVMIRGLKIFMKAEDLGQRISERIVEHQAAIAALDERLAACAGDKPYDVGLEDNFKAVEELGDDRQRLRDRLTQLALLRGSLIEGETYAMSKPDLRFAELISSDPKDTPGIEDNSRYDSPSGIPIEGLKLTIPGEELRKLLQKRQRDHKKAWAVRGNPGRRATLNTHETHKSCAQ